MSNTKLHSATLICSGDDRAAVDRLSCALGYAPYDETRGEPSAGTMIVPLSGSGEQPVTHYGAHTRADDAFIALFEAAADGTVPDAPQPGMAWSDFGLTRADAISIVGRVTITAVRDARAAESWAVALDDAGLSRVEERYD